VCGVCFSSTACQACFGSGYSLNNATGACDCAPGYAAKKVSGRKNTYLKCTKCRKTSVSPGGVVGKAVCSKCPKGTAPNADASFCVKAGEWPMASYDLTNRRWPTGEKALSNISVSTLKELWTYKPSGDTSATPMVVNNLMYMPTWCARRGGEGGGLPGAAREAGAKQGRGRLVSERLRWPGEGREPG
jgi:hypothetical protein